MRTHKIFINTLAVTAVFLSLFFACGAQAAIAEGKVKDSYGRIFLLDTGDVAFLDENASMANVEALREFFPGRMMRVVEGRRASGVVYATAVEADPVVEPFDPNRLVDIEEMSKIVSAKDGTLIIDVRPRGRYEAAHIPKSASMPLSGISRESLVAASGPDEKKALARPIIFYGDSERDISSHDAARKALGWGFKNIKVCQGCIEDWIYSNKHTLASPEYLMKAVNNPENIVIIDTRLPEKIGTGGFIPGAFNVPSGQSSYQRLIPVLDTGGAVTFLYNPLKPIIIYGEDGPDKGPLEAAELLTRTQYATLSIAPVNILEGGFRAWKKAGGPVANGVMETSVRYSYPNESGVVSFEEFLDIWREKGGDEYALVDLRNPERDRPDFMDNYPFVKNVPLHILPASLSGIPKDREIILFCKTGIRAAIGYEILRKNGFRARYLNHRFDMAPNASEPK